MTAPLPIGLLVVFGDGSVEVVPGGGYVPCRDRLTPEELAVLDRAASGANNPAAVLEEDTP